MHDRTLLHAKEKCCSRIVRETGISGSKRVKVTAASKKITWWRASEFVRLIKCY